METTSKLGNQVPLYLLPGAVTEIYDEITDLRYKWAKRKCSWDDILLRGKHLWGIYKWIQVIAQQYDDNVLKAFDTIGIAKDMDRLSVHISWCLDPSENVRNIPIAQPDCNFRKLRYYFLCLPYGRQIQIAQELSLFKKEDAGIKDPVLFTRLCERSLGEGKVLDFWHKSKEFYQKFGPSS